jgi:hypothetical protein
VVVAPQPTGKQKRYSLSVLVKNGHQFFMRIDITKEEFQLLIDALQGTMTRSQQKLRESLARRLDIQLHPSKAPDSNGWAPIRIKSSWPSGLVRQDRKSHWSFKRQSKSKPKQSKQPKKPLTADDILAEL